MDNTYQFTEAFQEKILTVLWQDPDSYTLYKECVKPRYFNKAVHIDICRIVFDYWEKYNTPPTVMALTEEVSEMLSKSKSKAKMEDEFIKALRRMSKTNLDDLGYVKDKIIGFGKKQAMVEAVVESADIIEKGGEYQKVEDKVKEALLVGENLSDIGRNIFDDVEERITSYTLEEDVIVRIPTSNEVLNKKMQGGLGKSEMGVVIAPPGRGKTTFLIDTGAAAVQNGYNVVHYSFENNEKQILRNYDTRLLEKDMDYIKQNVSGSIQALLNIKRFKRGELVVKKYPTKGASINTIRSHLKQVEAVKGIKFDVIIIDYGAIMKPITEYKDKRLTIESNYEDIRALADEFDCATWTAAQGNRGSMSKRVVTIADLAEAFAIANVSDFMIALCQTKREKLKGVMRYFIAKQRDSEDHITFMGSVLYKIKKMIIREEILVDDEDDDEEWEE